MIKACDIQDKKSYKFISVMVISLVLIIAGFYTILVSNLVFQSMGIILIVYSILELINYILLVSDNKETVHNTEVIETEAEEKKEVLEIENKNDNKKTKKTTKKKK